MPGPVRNLKRMRTAILLTLVSACASSVEYAPEPIDCDPDPCTVFHDDAPARGRMLACPTCALAESEYYARAIDLDCPLEQFPAEVCAEPTVVPGLYRACDYAALTAHVEEIRAASDCEALETVAFADPCTPPDPAVYWRDGGGCVE